MISEISKAIKKNAYMIGPASANWHVSVEGAASEAFGAAR